MKKISIKATTTDVLTSRLQNYFGNAFAHKLMISHDRIFDVNVVYAGEVLDLQLDSLARKATQDKDYQGILKLLRVQEGLENTMGESSIREYLGPKRFETFRKLTVLEMPGRGLVLYNNNIVFIPTTVRKNMLDILHKFHFAP